MKILDEEIWPKDKQLTVEVLVGNEVAQAFYKAIGFRGYSLELEIPASERNTQQSTPADQVLP